MFTIVVRPKKYLGQHFLTDTNIARKIVDSLKLDQTAQVLEIGPGMGVLTQFLVSKKFFDLSVVEVDTESVNYLKQHYPMLENKILEEDVLNLDLSGIYNDDIAVIGNFPYNISSPILFHLLNHRLVVKEVVAMLQREVAVRLAASPGNKDYGILSVLLQAHYQIEYLFTVNENVFRPPPKVKSGVVRLTRLPANSLDCSYALFRKVVKTAFNQRRKTLRNSLKPLAVKWPETELPILKKRPEQLSIDDFVSLTKLISQYQ